MPIHAVSSRVLGGVEGLVGALDHERIALAGQQLGDSAGDCHGEILAFETDAGLLDRLAGSFRGLLSLLDRGARQHDRELLAAVAGHDVRPRCAVWSENAGDSAKHFVAGTVPVAVVELFEMVNVREDERKGSPLALEYGVVLAISSSNARRFATASAASIRDSASFVLITRAVPGASSPPRRAAAASARCSR